MEFLELTDKDSKVLTFVDRNRGNKVKFSSPIKKNKLHYQNLFSVSNKYGYMAIGTNEGCIIVKNKNLYEYFYVDDDSEDGTFKVFQGKEIKENKLIKFDHLPQFIQFTSDGLYLIIIADDMLNLYNLSNIIEEVIFFF